MIKFIQKTDAVKIIKGIKSKENEKKDKSQLLTCNSDKTEAWVWVVVVIVVLIVGFFCGYISRDFGFCQKKSDTDDDDYK